MLKDVLREARSKKNLKQEDVANILNITKQTYLKWENGATEPKASQIAALAKALDITPNEICQGELYTRYSLDQFIIELTATNARSELETLASWEHIPDHKAYLERLSIPSAEDFADEKYTHDLQALAGRR
ncbi:helix-turn-helix transcriptional regulator [Shewanella gelidii]|uniref:HTH cro/C1-type domain-containing protein n=1 Tax=Shewanella gelidii TaxID=1642821 RepID=A0A917NDZ0_9GAMM|nr:helix-turn-helix transcriptional regulator [Shewanella gelidii]MCL1098082.1 helix-turn-helix transcriptional regulator [Shewanella gelidii]MCL1098089.1 helix-turn-helix transcriptional regulator [Shewanella gelidii]GGI93555.1 hypothetical protein GCM10009332_33500 [Shewanella gelidii]